MDYVKKEPINVWREKLRISQESLADQLGISRNTISRWESGQSIPSGYYLVKMGEIFGCGSDGIFLPFMSEKCGNDDE